MVDCDVDTKKKNNNRGINPSALDLTCLIPLKIIHTHLLYVTIVITTFNTFFIMWLSHIAELGHRTSPNRTILCPVAKSPVRQIWETDCTRERTCNEHEPVATNKERT